MRQARTRLVATLRSTVAAPASPLNDKPVTIAIFKGTPTLGPVWIERLNFPKSGREHTAASLFPFFGLGEVKNKQIFLCGRWLYGMDATKRELKVMVLRTRAEHDSIESIVIIKFADDLQFEALYVHGCGGRKIRDGASDSKLGAHSGFKRIRSRLSAAYPYSLGAWCTKKGGEMLLFFGGIANNPDWNMFSKRSLKRICLFGRKPAAQLNQLNTFLYKITGNEDDGFRVSIRNKNSNSKFANLDEAVMAVEMYLTRRRKADESQDYIEEA
jgi:hypothetical protein